MKFPAIAIVGALFIALSSITQAQEPTELPQPVQPTHFDALKKQSPFLRELNFSETYAIRALATIGDTPVATLFNRNTKETLLVIPEEENERGMKLIELVGGSTSLGVIAKIEFAGEVFEVKYDQAQTIVESSGGKGKGGDRKDGERKGPSKEDMDRYKALSDPQKEKFREYIRYSMKKYPDMSREERGNMIRGAMTKILDGRDVEMK